MCGQGGRVGRTVTRPKEMKVNVALWVAQVILALAILGAGFDQAANYDDAARRLAWIGALPRRFALVLGLLEMLAAVGLIVPAWSGVQPWLTIATALAIALLMLAAVTFHARRREVPQFAFSAAFLIVAAFVVIGRVTVAPF
jgi:hypothetical protein